mgnify:CR=1 FL=1
MAQDDIIPDEDHISRYAPGSKIHNIDGKEKVDFEVFLSKKPENYRSVDWLEFNGKKSIEACLQEVRQCFIDEGFNLKTTARFAILNIEKMRQKVQVETKSTRDLLVKHECDNARPCHAGIYGYEVDEIEIAKHIADSVIALPVAIKK